MFILILALFAIGAYFDLKKKMVPDLITALMWIWIGLFGDAQLSALVFGTMFILAIFSEELFGWADVLAGPAYAAAFAQIGFSHLGILGFCLPILISAILKKKVPCFPFYFIALAIASIFKYLIV